MNLSERLLAIISFVKEKSIVADIGTDHGYIPVYLLENNISKKAIASDISSSSLKKAEDYVGLKGLKNDVETRSGNGLDVIRPYEVDTVIIAGMGGHLIIDILENNFKKAETINNFILQPMVASKELRKYLYEHNFTIVDEKIILEEDKYYEIIYAKWGKEFIEDEIYYEISKILLERRDLLLKDFIENKVLQIDQIINTINLETSEKAQMRIDELLAKKTKYKEVLSLYESY